MNVQDNIINKKLVDKTVKRLIKLVKVSRTLSINPSNVSSLFIILPKLQLHTETILMKHEKNYELLENNEYFKIFIHSLNKRYKDSIELYKEIKDNASDDTNCYKRRITKLSLIFNHMFKDLIVIFPNGLYIENKFIITKSGPRNFWKTSFGDKCIVSWLVFRFHINQIYPIESGLESMALKTTIDLTSNNYVSIFEFDVFTRLFQPWSSIIKNWKALAVTHPGYVSFLSYDEVIERLKNYRHKPGSYVFRQSCTRLGQWAIGYVTNDGNISQTIVRNKSLYETLVEGNRDKYFLYPDGRDLNPDLTWAVMDTPEDHIKVTQEQYEIYCEIETTFELCKICTENDKNIRIEPCGHLLCKSCLTSWQKAKDKGCPFCRADIKSTAGIVVEPYVE